MSGVYKQALKSLQPGTQNALVIGIIVNSFNMKTIDAARTKFNNVNRGVWTFTLRDSEEDSINVTVWGSTQFVTKLSSTFHIGSIVEVINPKVIERRSEDRNELFVPWVSSSCSLTVNEGNALVQIHDAPTRARYESLLMLPIKNLTGLRTLKSIFENLEALRDQYVDILVVVTFISDIRNVITRDGRRIKFRNFEAVDGSTDEITSLILWENEWIERAALWEPKRTVLLLVDSRIAFDNFRKKTVLSTARKTMITENPNIPQSTIIRNAVQYYEDDIISGNFVTPNPNTITTVMTVQEISNKLNTKLKQGERIQFATILRAYVMDINVENISSTILSTRCALCKKIIPGNRDSCMNLECPSGNGTRVPLNIMSLNLKVNLRDNTGYLIGCRLFGDIAERVLGCTANDFQAMTLPQRAELKWKYALEKCEIRLHVVGPSSTFTTAVYNIVSICRIEENEDEDEDTQLINKDFVSTGY
ncbi:PREDICTED: meiosis-specific with OB domain-containing protein [Eufriesea mexicana]|uniref:meiosis-specific with OB domain-containing protein n=1 Tax=Eufriesea mexicana TaxID=516756 RepID=UPI00083C0D49|nr:PREDICTED: meiosis-specific with OB domain-containing protein [Eufriesea mexicana]